jgi:hypothetical protein
MMSKKEKTLYLFSGYKPGPVWCVVCKTGRAREGFVWCDACRDDSGTEAIMLRERKEFDKIWKKGVRND